MRRLGIYGGAFDPPHLAHEALARSAIAQYELDVLLIMPTGLAWHKNRTLSSCEHRIAMANLTFADLPQARIDVRETLRSGATYTMDTLLELQAEYPKAELFLALGQDQLANFTQWHRYAEILKIATLLVALRSDSMPGSKQKDRLNQGKIPYSTILMPASPISATQIRHIAGQLSANSQVLDHLVKPSVALYIAEHRLYRST